MRGGGGLQNLLARGGPGVLLWRDTLKLRLNDKARRGKNSRQGYGKCKGPAARMACLSSRNPRACSGQRNKGGVKKASR